MVCPKCRNNISDTASFCPACGYRIPRQQPQQVVQSKASDLGKAAWFAPVFVIIKAVIAILGVFLSCIILDINVSGPDPQIINFGGSLHAVAEPMINVAVNLISLAMCTLLFYAAAGKSNFKKYFPVAYFPFIIDLVINSIASLLAYALWVKFVIPYYLTKIIAAGVAAVFATPASFFLVRAYLKNNADQR